ncbi:MAG: hypothetical protein KC549_19535 [Myxococcales bacterium]|nr:hypothetical protein [Myxococcales bacterium]MCB9545848.1 hypothetical protein [Myxococcales bacterium]
MDEARLIEKLRKIEALFAGATTEGERQAAAEARARIQERLAAIAETDPPIEYRFTVTDLWSRRLLVALLRRYGLKPYRYPRQRRTTVMARVPARFVDETLWPEFESLWAELRGWLNDATERVVRLVTEQDADEAEVVERPAALGFDPDDDDDD